MEKYYIKRDRFGLGVFYKGVPQFHGTQKECKNFINTHKPEVIENRTPLLNRDNY